jgi:hypothetical protein
MKARLTRAMGILCVASLGLWGCDPGTEEDLGNEEREADSARSGQAIVDNANHVVSYGLSVLNNPGKSLQIKVSAKAPGKRVMIELSCAENLSLSPRGVFSLGSYVSLRESAHDILAVGSLPDNTDTTEYTLQALATVTRAESGLGPITPTAQCTLKLGLVPTGDNCVAQGNPWLYCMTGRKAPQLTADTFKVSLSWI